MVQQQKHQQAKYYDKSAKDLPRIETGNAVYVHLVLSVRKCVSGTIIEKISDSSYKVNTVLGVVYVRNHKIRHMYLRQP